jgi:mRNA-degrading endonuclease RelE of RelBE toxin-antitoxin system
MSVYRIRIKNSSVEKGWYALEENYPEAMGRCKTFLQNSPLDRLKSGGKLKKLKGKLSGILQYDITDSLRVRYTVDNRERIVFVEYIGEHP